VFVTGLQQGCDRNEFAADALKRDPLLKMFPQSISRLVPMQIACWSQPNLCFGMQILQAQLFSLQSNCNVERRETANSIDQRLSLSVNVSLSLSNTAMLFSPGSRKSAVYG